MPPVRQSGQSVVSFPPVKPEFEVQPRSQQKRRSKRGSLIQRLSMTAPSLQTYSCSKCKFEWQVSSLVKIKKMACPTCGEAVYGMSENQPSAILHHCFHCTFGCMYPSFCVLIAPFAPINACFALSLPPCHVSVLFVLNPFVAILIHLLGRLYLFLV